MIAHAKAAGWDQDNGQRDRADTVIEMTCTAHANIVERVKAITRILLSNTIDRLFFGHTELPPKLKLPFLPWHQLYSVISRMVHCSLREKPLRSSVRL